MKTATLYDTDFYAWTQQQATLLRNEELAELACAPLSQM